MNYETGELTTTIESAFVRKITKLPTELARAIIYTPAMMQAMRQFAWQGGAGQDVEQTTLAILKQDLPDWGEIESTQWVRIGGGTYEVVNTLKMAGGWILNVKRTHGTESGAQVTVDQETGIEQSTGFVVE